jgi:hypothetical protein
MSSLLHERADFRNLIRVAASELGIADHLVEKDYWIMQVLWGLQQQQYDFALKGGTSLSKGFRIIDRFSEDIDIWIAPPAGMDVKTGKNHDKPAHVASRRKFYDRLAGEIRIPGITNVVRDTAFDNKELRSGGIRLSYESLTATPEGFKDGILLELGFDLTTPNEAVNISSWAYDKAALTVADEIMSNRAIGVRCYHPGYTLVEKLQTISTKYRQFKANGTLPANFLRHYYDVHCLLQNKSVLEFVGTDDYHAHKRARFRQGDEPVISNNPAFAVNDVAERRLFETEYQRTRTLYYRGQPPFAELLVSVAKHRDRL